MMAIVNKKKFVIITCVIVSIITLLVGFGIFYSQFPIIHLKNQLNDSTISLEFINNFKDNEEDYTKSTWDYYKLNDEDLNQEKLQEISYEILNRWYNRIGAHLSYELPNLNYEENGRFWIKVSNDEGDSLLRIDKLDEYYYLSIEPAYNGLIQFSYPYFVKFDLKDTYINNYLMNYFNISTYNYDLKTMTLKELNKENIPTYYPQSEIFN